MNEKIIVIIIIDPTSRVGYSDRHQYKIDHIFYTWSINIYKTNVRQIIKIFGQDYLLHAVIVFAAAVYIYSIKVIKIFKPF